MVKPRKGNPMFTVEQLAQIEKQMRFKHLKDTLRSQSPMSTKVEFVNLVLEFEHCSNDEALAQLNMYIKRNNKRANDKYKK